MERLGQSTIDFSYNFTANTSTVNLMMPQRLWSGRSAGFTLVELLIALVLLSFVFLLLASGLKFGTNVWSRQNKELSNNVEIHAAQDFLRRVLSEARPVMIEADPARARHVFFEGSNNSIRFIAPMPGHLGMGGFYELTIYLAEGDQSGNRIELSWRISLMSGVRELQFAYFGYRGQQNEPARWYNDWQGLQFIPSLIRVQTKLSEGDWPDLVVAPMVQSIDLIIEPESTN
jgi:general secretion pathway protein J